jgi:hypothetical protein
MYFLSLSKGSRLYVIVQCECSNTHVFVHDAECVMEGIEQNKDGTFEGDAGATGEPHLSRGNTNEGEGAALGECMHTNSAIFAIIHVTIRNLKYCNAG